MKTAARNGLIVLALLYHGHPGWVASGDDDFVGIRRVGQMPNLPEPFAIRDWRQVAIDFDRLAFDSQAKGQHLPLIRLVRDARGEVVRFGLPSYVGDTRFDRKDAVYEGVTTMGAIVGASLVGLDKSAGQCDFVRMCEVYFDQRPTHRIVGNQASANPDQSYWYSLFPNVLFLGLADLYPKQQRIAAMARESALQWAKAVEALTDASGKTDFDATGFDFATMKAAANNRWKEPDAAGAIAWIEYAAYRKWGENRCLTAADRCLRFLSDRPADKNPYYECLLPFGALAAARMNAELGRDYDLSKIINWCFDRSAARIDWTMLATRWEEKDVHGLMGGIGVPPWRTWEGGYAFAMNTYCQALAIMPIARYDPRYARDIGKWMLNAANAARLFYGDAHPPSRQTSPDWKGDPGHVIAYEGLKYRWDSPDQPLTAAGDPIRHKWGPTDLSIYSSALVGVFGAIIARIDDPAVLRLDLLATDLFRDRAYPTYLYYNPHSTARTVKVDVGPTTHDLYDAVRGEWVGRSVIHQARIDIRADAARVIVLVPSEKRQTQTVSQTLVDGVVIDYRRGGPAAHKSSKEKAN
jgi:hypothetical protein